MLTPEAKPCASDEVMTAWNEFRAQGALESVSCAGDLEQLASSRVSYLLHNGFSTADPHREERGSPGYTGATLRERAEAAEALDSRHWLHEGVAQGRRSHEMAGAFIDSVYHRALVLAPALREVGAAVNGRYAAALIRESIRPKGGEAVHYPFAGQIDVPCSFHSDEEWPDPVSGRDEVGYPVSLFLPRRLSDSGKIVVREALLVDAEGNEVPVNVLHHGNNQATRKGELHLIPLSPLQPEMQYAATVDVDYDGVAFRKDWLFTTGG